MKIILLTVLVVFFINPLFAQDFIIKNVEAERIDKDLYLEYLSKNKDTNLYYIENIDRYSPIKIKDNAVFAANSNLVNVWMRFLNPLKYQVTVDQKVEQDTTFSKSLSLFFEALNSVLSYTTTSTSNVGLAAFINEKSKRSPDSIAETYKLHSLEAIQIFLWLSSVQLQKEISNFKNLEVFFKFFSIVDESMTNESFETHTKGLIINLSKAESIGSLTSVVNDDFSPELVNLKLEIESEKNSVNRLKTYDLNLFLKSDTTISYNLVSTYITRLLEKYEKILTLRNTQLKKLYSIQVMLNDYINQIWVGDYYNINNSVPVERMNLVYLTISVDQVRFQNNLISENKRILTNKIILKRYNNWLLNISAATIFTNVTYSQYGTDKLAGQTIVTSTTDEKDRFSVAACINILKNSKNSTVLLGLQIGVAPAKEYPFIFTGICMNIPDYNFSISLGGLFAWDRKLSNLNIGDPVSGTSQIVANTSWKFNNIPHLYLGLNYNIANKKK